MSNASDRGQDIDPQRLRERMRRVLERHPLPADEKARLMADAEYTVACLYGLPARPPRHWSQDQIAAFAAIMADPSGREAVLAWVVSGRIRLVQAAMADDDPEPGAQDAGAPGA
jgi:hypothetical protein